MENKFSFAIFILAFDLFFCTLYLDDFLRLFHCLISLSMLDIQYSISQEKINSFYIQFSFCFFFEKSFFSSKCNVY